MIGEIFNGALLSHATIEDMLRACRNPLYPTHGDIMRLRQHLRTFKGDRKQTWWTNYLTQQADEDYHRSVNQ